MSDYNLGTPEEALKFAQNYVGSKEYNDRCEAFFENAYGIRGKYGSAKAHYTDSLKNKRLQTGSTPPPGAAVFISGNKKYGHVALSVGNGEIISTGINGKVQRVKIADMPKIWGSHGTYLGWDDPVGGLKGGAPFKASSMPSYATVNDSSVGSTSTKSVSQQFKPTIAASAAPQKVF